MTTKVKPQNSRGIYNLDPKTKTVSSLKRDGNTYFFISFIDQGKKLAFYSNYRLFGNLITPTAIGVYDLKTRVTRYVSFMPSNLRQMTVAEDGKYLITAEGQGRAVVLYKRSLLGGFKLPIMKPVKTPTILEYPSQDEYPDWHA